MSYWVRGATEPQATELRLQLCFNSYLPGYLQKWFSSFLTQNVPGSWCLQKGIWINALCVHMLSCFSHVQLFVIPWTEACQAPLSMGFSRQEIWSELHALLQGIFPIQGLNPYLLHLLHWQEGSLPLVPPGKPWTYALFVNNSQTQTSSQLKSLDHNHISAWTQTPCFGLLAVLSLRTRLASLAHSMQIHACCLPLTAHLEAQACFASKNIRIMSAVFLSSKIRASNIWNKQGNRTKSLRR